MVKVIATVEGGRSNLSLHDKKKDGGLKFLEIPP